MQAAWTHRTGVVGAVLLGGALASAGPVHADVIGGLGNAAFGNVCVNHSSSSAAGATADGPGFLTSNAGQPPLAMPRNNCGTQGATGFRGNFG